ncbi:MAG: MFS transporter [Parabacteroides gordonii]|nr:MFS transporter [Parabacteroides gordonii]
MSHQALLSVPIRPWVPRWLGIVTAFVVMLPIILINGAYTGNITEVSGTLGVLSEDISMAYYATSAGMAVAYPLIPKVRPVVTAQLAYHYQWQYMYYFVILLLLVAISFILMFFRYARRPVYFPFKEIDWKSILLMASILLFTIWSATYGKTLDWFSSAKITVYVLSLPVLVWLFLFRQKTARNPYLRLEVLNSSKALIGYFYMMLVMFFSATSSLVTSYMNSIIRVDSIHANFLNLWMLPGFICGAVICFWWFRWQRWRFRVLISGGMLCHVIYLTILYFGITPDGRYEMLYLPMFLRGMGMMILFIAFGVFVVEDMNPKLMIYNAFFLITCRSVIAPALASSFFNNMLYRVQLQGMTILSENMRMDNPVAAQLYEQSRTGMLAQGHSMTDATTLVCNSLYTTLQTQSLLLALKTIIGYVLIFAIVVMVISRFTPFHKTLKVEIVKTGEDMV